MTNLTIAVLNFNSGEYLSKCLESIKEVKEEAAISIIVIDNNSFDDSLKLAEEKFKDVEYVRNSDNYGFSKGYNSTLKRIKSEFVLLLNPDCLLEKGVIKKILEDFKQDPKIGAATGIRGKNLRLVLNGLARIMGKGDNIAPWASDLWHRIDVEIKRQESDLLNRYDEEIERHMNEGGSLKDPDIGEDPDLD